MPKLTPAGGQRGIKFPSSGMGATLETGTVGLLWKVLKPGPAGPKG